MLNRFIELDRNTLNRLVDNRTVALLNTIANNIVENRIVLQSANFRGENRIVLWVYYAVDGINGVTINEGVVDIDKGKFRFRSKHV